MAERNTETHTATWRGITISITFEAHFMNLTAIHLSWIGITSEGRVPLPISETGFASKYLPPVMFAEHDGPVGFAIGWLDYAAQQTGWQAERQLSLF